MRTERGEPSRIPLRGTLALAATAGGLGLLVALRPGPPEDVVLALAPTPASADLPAPATGAEPSPSAPGASPSRVASASASASPSVMPQESATAVSATLVGDPVPIRWGTVQVEVTIEDGRLIDVRAIEMPSGDRHTNDLSERAESRLEASALEAQGAHVDVVSGATYTSRAYAESLQSALDQLEG